MRSDECTSAAAMLASMIAICSTHLHASADKIGRITTVLIYQAYAVGGLRAPALHAVYHAAAKRTSNDTVAYAMVGVVSGPPDNTAAT